MESLQIIYFKDAERVLRLVMIITLATAGISKLMSNDGFYDYYSSAFEKESLRINLPEAIVQSHLFLTPIFEIAIALGLLFTKYRRYAVMAWCLFFITIEFGHYILEEWSAVNEIIPYQILGVLCYILPSHASWIRRDSDSN